MDLEGRHVKKSRPRSSTKRGPSLRASLRTKGKRMQRFCQVPRECPVKFPRREGLLFLLVEDGPARVGRSTWRAPRLRAQAQQRERSKPEIAAGRSVRRRRVRARRAHGRELHFELARNVKARFVAPISVIWHWSIESMNVPNHLLLQVCGPDPTQAGRR